LPESPRAALLLAAALSIAAPASAAKPLPDRIDSYLRTKASGPFSGVVLVAQFGQILFHRAYGWADAERAVPNSLGTRFAYASLTKPVTAAAVLHQVERDAIRLDASICDYLAQCPAAWRPATIRHLLSHTSGIPDLAEAIGADGPPDFRAAIDRAAAAHAGRGLASRPGSTYAYSNFGYYLLGYALEVATGKSWFQAAREAVIAPAAMMDTGFGEDYAAVPQAAAGYRRVDPNTLALAPYRSPHAYAAGGLVGTAEDLVRFDLTLSRYKIIAPATLAQMTEPGSGRYGLGWQLLTVLGRAQRNHTGQLPGFAGHLASYADGTQVVVLSNIDNEPVQDTACDLAALAFGLEPSAPGTPACRPAA
jgi:CubicO group peptidase (beta-lactamase class C family)